MTKYLRLQKQQAKCTTVIHREATSNPGESTSTHVTGQKPGSSGQGSEGTIRGEIMETMNIEEFRAMKGRREKDGSERCGSMSI